MIFDRPYMREVNGRPAFSALHWLIGSIVGSFIVENIFLRWFSASVGAEFMRWTTVSPETITQGFVWTLLTHGVIHNPNQLFDLVFTLLAIFMFGRAIIAEIGDKQFLQVFCGAIVLGGVSWLGVNWFRGGQLFGASAGVSALIVLFACLNPTQSITFFMMDVGMRAKHLAIGLLVVEVLGLVLAEIPGHISWFAMAHSAHLGGMAAGWLFFRVFHQQAWTPFPANPLIELPRWFQRRQKKSIPAPVFKVNLGNRDDLKAEVDRILDKINSDGFHSLTKDEKRNLDQARDHLSRR